MVHGARISLAVGLSTVAVSLTLGVLLGALAGYLGGWTDELISRAVDVLLAFPGILLAVALAAIMGPTLPNVVIALSVLGWTGYARLTRTQVMTLRQRDFVAAARVLGVGPVRIVWRHILPLAAPLLLVQATFGLSGAILAEAALSFLGLGVPPPLPSWGAMLDEGRTFMLVAPHLVLAPGLALALTVLALQLLGDGLRDVLDFGDVRTPQRWHREQ
jgi:peptide/nickel transport system permease protein